MTLSSHIIREGRTIPVQVRKHIRLGFWTVKRRFVGDTQDGARFSRAIGPRLQKWEARIETGAYQRLLCDEVVFYRMPTGWAGR